LTLDRYSHAGLFDVAGALEKLPPLPGRGPSSEPAALPATGTEGAGRANAAELRQAGGRLAVSHYTRRDSNPQPSVPKAGEPVRRIDSKVLGQSYLKQIQPHSQGVVESSEKTQEVVVPAG